MHDLLGVVISVVRSIRHTDQLSDGRTVALFYRAWIEDIRGHFRSRVACCTR